MPTNYIDLFADYEAIDPNNPETISRALARGTGNVVSGIGELTTTIGPDAIGKPIAEFGKGLQERNYPIGPSRVEDIHSVGDFLSVATNAVAEQIPLLLYLGLSRGAGSKFLKAPSATMFAAGYPVQYGDVLENLRAKGIEGADTKALLPALGANFLEMAPFELLFSPIGAVKNIASRAGRAAAQAGVVAGSEAVTETGQELISMFAERLHGADISTDEAQSRLINAAFLGAIGGGVFGGVGGAATRGPVTAIPDTDISSPVTTTATEDAFDLTGEPDISQQQRVRGRQVAADLLDQGASFRGREQALERARKLFEEGKLSQDEYQVAVDYLSPDTLGSVSDFISESLQLGKQSIEMLQQTRSGYEKQLKETTARFKDINKRPESTEKQKALINLYDEVNQIQTYIRVIEDEINTRTNKYQQAAFNFEPDINADFDAAINEDTARREAVVARNEQTLRDERESPTSAFNTALEVASPAELTEGDQVFLETDPLNSATVVAVNQYGFARVNHNGTEKMVQATQLRKLVNQEQLQQKINELEGQVSSGQGFDPSFTGEEIAQALAEVRDKNPELKVTQRDHEVLKSLRGITFSSINIAEEDMSNTVKKVLKVLQTAAVSKREDVNSRIQTLRLKQELTRAREEGRSNLQQPISQAPQQLDLFSEQRKSRPKKRETKLYEDLVKFVESIPSLDTPVIIWTGEKYALFNESQQSLSFERIRGRLSLLVENKKAKETKTPEAQAKEAEAHLLERVSEEKGKAKAVIKRFKEIIGARSRYEPFSPEQEQELHKLYSIGERIAAKIKSLIRGAFSISRPLKEYHTSEFLQALEGIAIAERKKYNEALQYAYAIKRGVVSFDEVKKKTLVSILNGHPEFSALYKELTVEQQNTFLLAWINKLSVPQEQDKFFSEISDQVFADIQGLITDPENIQPAVVSAEVVVLQDMILNNPANYNINTRLVSESFTTHLRDFQRVATLRREADAILKNRMSYFNLTDRRISKYGIEIEHKAFGYLEQLEKIPPTLRKTENFSDRLNIVALTRLREIKDTIESLVGEENMRLIPQAQARIEQLEKQKTPETDTLRYRLTAEAAESLAAIIKRNPDYEANPSAKQVVSTKKIAVSLERVSDEEILLTISPDEALTRNKIYFTSQLNPVAYLYEQAKQWMPGEAGFRKEALNGYLGKRLDLAANEYYNATIIQATDEQLSGLKLIAKTIIQSSATNKESVYALIKENFSVGAYDSWLNIHALPDTLAGFYELIKYVDAEILVREHIPELRTEELRNVNTDYIAYRNAQKADTNSDFFKRFIAVPTDTVQSYIDLAERLRKNSDKYDDQLDQTVTKDLRARIFDDARYAEEELLYRRLYPHSVIEATNLYFKRTQQRKSFDSVVLNKIKRSALLQSLIAKIHGIVTYADLHSLLRSKLDTKKAIQESKDSHARALEDLKASNVERTNTINRLKSIIAEQKTNAFLSDFDLVGLLTTDEDFSYFVDLMMQAAETNVTPLEFLEQTLQSYESANKLVDVIKGDLLSPEFWDSFDRYFRNPLKVSDSLRKEWMFLPRAKAIAAIKTHLEKFSKDYASGKSFNIPFNKVESWSLIDKLNARDVENVKRIELARKVFTAYNEMSEAERSITAATIQLELEQRSTITAIRKADEPHRSKILAVMKEIEDLTKGKDIENINAIVATFYQHEKDRMSSINKLRKFFSKLLTEGSTEEALGDIAGLSKPTVPANSNTEGLGRQLYDAVSENGDFVAATSSNQERLALLQPIMQAQNKARAEIIKLKKYLVDNGIATDKQVNRDSEHVLDFLELVKANIEAKQNELNRLEQNQVDALKPYRNSVAYNAYIAEQEARKTVEMAAAAHKKMVARFKEAEKTGELLRQKEILDGLLSKNAEDVTAQDRQKMEDYLELQAKLGVLDRMKLFEYSEHTEHFTGKTKRTILERDVKSTVTRAREEAGIEEVARDPFSSDALDHAVSLDEVDIEDAESLNSFSRLIEGKDPAKVKAQIVLVKQAVDLIHKLLGTDKVVIETPRQIVRDGTYRAGSYTPSMTLIKLAMNAAEPVSAAAHEGWHAIRHLLLNKQEGAIVARAFSEGKPIRNLLEDIIRQTQGGNAEAILDSMKDNILEAEAYAFQYYQRGDLKVSGTLATVFDKVSKFFRRIYNWITGNGFQTWEDVFDAALAGEFANRQPSIESMKSFDITVERIKAGKPAMQSYILDSNAGTADLSSDGWIDAARAVNKSIVTANWLTEILPSWMKNIFVNRNAEDILKVARRVHIQFLRSLQSLARKSPTALYVFNSLNDMFSTRGIHMQRAWAVLENLTDDNIVPVPVKVKLMDALLGGTEAEQGWGTINEFGQKKSEAEIARLRAKLAKEYKLTSPKEQDWFFAIRDLMDDMILKEGNAHKARHLEVAELRKASLTESLKRAQERLASVTSEEERIAAEKEVTRLSNALERVKPEQEKIAKDYFDNAQRLVRTGYFPKRRFGKYIVRVERVEGDKRTLLSYFHTETQAEQDFIYRKMQDIAADNNNIRVIKDTVSEKRMISAALEVENLLLLESEGLISIKPDDRKILLRRMTADNKVLSKLKRNDVPGESYDLLRVVAEGVKEMASSIANATTTHKIDHFLESKTTSEWETEAEAAGLDTGTLRERIVNTMNYVRYNDVMSDEIDTTYGKLRMAAAVAYLGGNVSHGVIQLSQLAMATAPWLSSITSFPTAYSQILKAVKDTAAPLTDLDKFSLKRLRAGAGYANLSQTEVSALAKSVEEGITEAHQIHEFMGIAEGKIWAKNPKARKAVELWMSPFTMSEELNRRSTFIAAFRIANQMLAEGKTLQSPSNKLVTFEGEDAAYQFAKHAVQETQFVYHRANRAPFGREGLSSVLMIFKSYPLFMMELLKALPPRGRITMMSTLFMTAGLAGFMLDDLEDIMETFTQWLGIGAPDMRHAIDERLQALADLIGIEDLPEIIMYGPMNYALSQAGLGVDLGSRLGFQNVIPGTSILKQTDSFSEKFEETVGPASGIFKGIWRTSNAVVRQDWTSSWMSFSHAVSTVAKESPLSGIANFAKGLEAIESGEFRDRRGYLMTSASVMDGMFKAIGFTSTKFNRIMDKTQSANKIHSYLEQARQDYILDILNARRRRDSAAEKALWDGLNNWNKSHPEPFYQIKVTPESLRRYGKTMNLTTIGRARASLGDEAIDDSLEKLEL